MPTCSPMSQLCRKATADTSCHQTVSPQVRLCSEASKLPLGYLASSGYHNTNGQEARWAILKVRRSTNMSWDTANSFSLWVSPSPLGSQASWRKLSHVLAGSCSMKVFTPPSCIWSASLFSYPVPPTSWLVWFACWCYGFVLLGNTSWIYFHQWALLTCWHQWNSKKE